MPPKSHLEFEDCPDCHCAVWRYTFYHPGQQHWVHVIPAERDVCPGYLHRKQQAEEWRNATAGVSQPD